MVEVILLLQCSGVYWFRSDYFPKARSTLLVQDQAPYAEVSESKLGISLALQLGVRAVWAKAYSFFDSSQCSFVRLERKKYSF